MTALGTVFRESLRGKTLGRILVNDAVRSELTRLHGRVLDVAGGVEPSYLRYVPSTVEFVRTNLTPSDGVTALDFNTRFPFEDSTFDAVILFNALYAADDPSHVAREVHRVLKPDGTWLLVSPFIANEMPEPHDYVRFTAEGLARLMRAAGFNRTEIIRVGERASAAAHLMHPFFLFKVVRALVFPLAVVLDRCIPERVQREHPTPISYFVICKKDQ